MPSGLFSTNFTLLTSWSYDVSGNSLTGPVPVSLSAPLASLSGFRTLTFAAGSNQLTGTVPDFWNGLTLNNLYSLSVDLSGNRLADSVPSYLSPSFSLGIFNYNLASNQLNGTIASNLISATLSASYTLNLANNKISGNLPSTLSMSNLKSITLSLASNSLTGTLPSSFLSNAGSLVYLSLTLSNNKFEGSVPSDFLTAIVDKVTMYTTSIYVYLSNCGLSGAFPVSLRGTAWYSTVDISNNAFTGSIPSAFFTGTSSNHQSGSMVSLYAAHNN